MLSDATARARSAVILEAAARRSLEVEGREGEKWERESERGYRGCLGCGWDWERDVLRKTKCHKEKLIKRTMKRCVSIRSLLR